MQEQKNYKTGAQAPLSPSNSRGNLILNEDTSLKRRQTRPHSAPQPGALSYATPLFLTLPVCDEQQGRDAFSGLCFVRRAILCSVDTPSPTSYRGARHRPGGCVPGEEGQRPAWARTLWYAQTQNRLGVCQVPGGPLGS